MRYDTNKFRHDVKHTSTYVMTKKVVMMWKLFHDVKKFVMKTNTRHDVKKFFMTSKSVSWRQKHVMTLKIDHDVKNTSWRK